MYFFNICENPDILRIIYFGLKILDLVFVAIPMVLIVMITIDIFKIIISADSDKIIKENHKSLTNRIIFAITIFFVPTIVSFITNVLTDTVGFSTNYRQCMDNANKESIERYQLIKNEKDENEATQNNNNTATEDIYIKLAEEMVKIATNEVGYKEGSNDSNKYGTALGRPNCQWCVLFVNWVAKETTVENTNVFDDIIIKQGNLSGIASTASTILHFNNKDNLKFHYSEHYGENYIPKAGDYIFFDFQKEWNKKMTLEDIRLASQHTGMVIETKDGKVYTIEGNTGNGEVKKKSYDLNSESIMGYGSWYNN